MSEERAYLIIMSGAREGNRIEVIGEMTIGRRDADVTLGDDDEVSRHHALVRAVSGALEVVDLESRNGTWVEGRRIAEATRLVDGARLRVGMTDLQVELAGAAADETRVATPVLEPDATQASAPVPEAGATVAGAAHAPPVRPATPALTPAAAAPAGAFPDFRPTHRRGGAATRSVSAAALVILIILATAVVLAIYFAQR
jgi:predicted component of type VI protein secretion system